MAVPAKGVIIYYLNVGNMEGSQVLQHLERRKQDYLKQPGVAQVITESGYILSMIPVRGSEDTRLELLQFP